MTSKVVSDIDAIINSRSVAFFGVSSIGGKLGNVLMQGFLDIGFKKSKLFPINPKATEILGLKAYKSLKDVEERVDLVIIALHPKIVLEVVEECVEKEVKGIIFLVRDFEKKVWKA